MSAQTKPTWLVVRARHPAFTMRMDRRVPIVAAIIIVITLAVMIWDVGTGEYAIAPLDVLKTMLGMDTGHPEYSFVVNDLRVPRVLVAYMVGVMLALAGCVLQTLTHNPLASPELTGVSAGAALGVIALIVLAPQAQLVSLPFAAFAGGIAVAIFIYFLAWREGDSPLRLLLVGIGLTAMLSAAMSILMLRAPVERVQSALLWLTGSIYARSWSHFFALLPWFAVLVPLVWFFSRQLNALNLGEIVARGVGMNVTRERALLLFAAIALTGAAISQVGALGFVGLMTPHLARRLVGTMHEGLVFISALLGGLLVVAADFAGHTLFAPTEVPAGIMIAFIGAPFFIFLLWKNRAQF